MFLDRLKTLMAATALVGVLGACEADAGIAEADIQDPAAEEGEGLASDSLVLRFEDLPPAEREARLALGEEIVRLTAPAEFLDAMDESVAQAVRLNTPAHYPDLSAEEQARVNTLASEYAAQYEDQIMPRLREVYAYLYTVDEMEDIVTFFTSETGEKYRALTNEVNNELGQALQTIMMAAMEDMMREVRPEAFEPETAPSNGEAQMGETVIDLNAANADADETTAASTPGAPTDPNE